MIKRGWASWCFWFGGLLAMGVASGCTSPKPEPVAPAVPIPPVDGVPVTKFVVPYREGFVAYEELENRPDILENTVPRIGLLRDFGREMETTGVDRLEFRYTGVLYIDETGAVVDVIIVQSNTNRFQDEVIRACLQGRYEVGIRNGQPQKYYVLQAFYYDVN